MSLFTETVSTDDPEPVHPLDVVMKAFQSEDAAAATVQKISVFMEDAFKIHGRKLNKVNLPTAIGQNIVYITHCFGFTSSDFGCSFNLMFNHFLEQ